MFKRFFSEGLSQRLEQNVRLQALLLFALVFAVYANTLGKSELIWDDVGMIAGNLLLRHGSSLLRLLYTGYWEASFGTGVVMKEYRPLLMLSYFLTYRLFEATPWAYHLGNMLLHAGNCFLALLLWRRHYAPRTAFLAAAVFAVLPVHAEAVAWISGRSELLVFFFILCSWLAFESPTPRKGWGTLAFALGLLSKEQAVMFPLVLALYEWTWCGTRPWEASRRGHYGLMVEVLFFYGCLRLFVLHHTSLNMDDYFVGRNYLTRLLTLASFYGHHYVAPLVCGFPFQLDYTWPAIPDASYKDPWAWLVLANWCLLLGLAGYGCLRQRSKPAFWILAAFLFLFPASNLIIRLDSLGADRFLYLPSLAYCILLCDLLLSLRVSWKMVLPTGIIFGYALLSVSRNTAWRSEVDHCKTLLRADPYSAKALCQWGAILLDHDKPEAAIHLFHQAAMINPYIPSIYYNLGTLYVDRKDWRRAAVAFERTLALIPSDPDTLTSLGVVFERQGHLSQAAQCYRRALRYQSYNAAAQYNLAQLLLKEGKLSEAVLYFQAFLKIDPTDPKASAVKKLLAQIQGP